MIDEIYKNRMLYYNLMKNFLKNKITAWKFRTKYWNQRDKDLDENKKNGYNDYYLNRVLVENSERFQKEYEDPLYEQGLVGLKKYEQGANELNIKGELFFMGIWNYLDCFIKDYYPSQDEGFDPGFNIDEKTLTEIIHAAFDILKRNKKRWINDQNNSLLI